MCGGGEVLIDNLNRLTVTAWIYLFSTLRVWYAWLLCEKMAGDDQSTTSFDIQSKSGRNHSGKGLHFMVSPGNDCTLPWIDRRSNELEVISLNFKPIHS